MLIITENFAVKNEESNQLCFKNQFNQELFKIMMQTLDFANS